MLPRKVHLQLTRSNGQALIDRRKALLFLHQRGIEGSISTMPFGVGEAIDFDLPYTWTDEQVMDFRDAFMAYMGVEWAN